MTSEHPADLILRKYHLGKLDPEPAAQVRAHIKECATCRGRVQSMTVDGMPAASDARAASRRAVSAAPSTEGGFGTTATTATATVPEIPDYEIVKTLGGGGMGVVYLARNLLMERLEALKVLSQHLVNQPQAMERFLREIQAAAKLQHPNIVAAHTALRWNGGLILAMEYIEGEDLYERVERRGPLPVAEACFYAYQAAQGLQHAHGKGMVHRDIKPHNLILDVKGGKGVVKILDFGLAKVTSEGPVDGGITRHGATLGTADYISPEQIRNAKAADIRADIYSLGCTLYFLLNGAPPFAGKESLYDIFQAHHSLDAASLAGIRPDVPVELAALVAKMMAKEPEHRFQAPAEVAAALRPFLQALARQSTPVAKVAPAAPPAGNGTRRATIAEEIPLADEAPTAGRRKATIVQEGAAAEQPPNRPARRQATLVEGGQAGDLINVTLDDNFVIRKPKAAKASAPQEVTPAWRRPAVIASAAGAAVALLGIGVGIFIAMRDPTGTKGTIAAPPPPVTPAPGNDGLFAALAETIRPKDQASAPAAPPAGPKRDDETKPNGSGTGRHTPVEFNPKPPVDTPKRPIPPDETPKQEDAEPDNGEQPAGFEAPRIPGADELGRKKPAPVVTRREIIKADFAEVGSNPESFAGRTILLNSHLTISTRLYIDDPKRVPGYGTLRVGDKDDRILSNERAVPEGKSRLGIVLEKDLASEFESFRGRAEIKASVMLEWRVIPAVEVRRVRVGGAERWLVVIVAMEFVASQDNDKVKAGAADGAFETVHFGRHEPELSLLDNAEIFARLEGAKEGERLKRVAKTNETKIRRFIANQQLNQGRSVLGGAMQQGAAAAQQRNSMQTQENMRNAGVK